MGKAILNINFYFRFIISPDIALFLWIVKVSTFLIVLRILFGFRRLWWFKFLHIIFKTRSSSILLIRFYLRHVSFWLSSVFMAFLFIMIFRMSFFFMYTPIIISFSIFMVILIWIKPSTAVILISILVFMWFLIILSLPISYGRPPPSLMPIPMPILRSFSLSLSLIALPWSITILCFSSTSFLSRLWSASFSSSLFILWSFFTFLLHIDYIPFF